MKTVLVTGSALNLGKDIIVKYAQNNYNVIINYLSHEKEAKALEKKLKKYNVKTLIIKCDITNEKDILNMTKIIKKEFNKIDVLINNASIDITNEIKDKNKNDYLKVLEVNLIGTFLVTKSISKLINKGGSIINIASNNATTDYNPISLEYDSSKAAIINLTHNLANIYSPNIRVNCICPGWIETNETKNMNPNFIKSEKDKILLNRFAKTTEIANLIYFLTSSEASYINDSIITIDGGKKC